MFPSNYNQLLDQQLEMSRSLTLLGQRRRAAADRHDYQEVVRLTKLIGTVDQARKPVVRELKRTKPTYPPLPYTYSQASPLHRFRAPADYPSGYPPETYYGEYQPTKRPKLNIATVNTPMSHQAKHPPLYYIDRSPINSEFSPSMQPGHFNYSPASSASITSPTAGTNTIITGYNGYNTDPNKVFIQLPNGHKYQITDFLKTKTCLFYNTGVCKDPVSCTRYHFCDFCGTLDTNNQTSCRCANSSAPRCPKPMFTCNEKDDCHYKHSHSERVAWRLNSTFSLTNTRMCRYFDCRNDRCTFAHSEQELRCILCRSKTCSKKQCKRNPTSIEFSDPLDWLDGMYRAGVVMKEVDDVDDVERDWDALKIYE